MRTCCFILHGNWHVSKNKKMFVVNCVIDTYIFCFLYISVGIFVCNLLFKLKICVTEDKIVSHFFLYAYNYFCFALTLLNIFRLKIKFLDNYFVYSLKQEKIYEVSVYKVNNLCIIVINFKTKKFYTHSFK